MRRGLWLLFITVWMALLPVRALANSGPPHETGDRPGAVLPARSTTVHVLKEHLRMEVAEALDEAKVTARYEMENRGPGVDALPVLFVLQDFAAGWRASSLPVVTWNGEPLPVGEVKTDQSLAEERKRMREAWGGESQVIDPVSGQVYSLRNDYGHPVDGDEWQMRYVRFELPLEAGEKGSLEVSYQAQAGFDRTRYVYPVYHFQYLLLPARGWASFGPLEIEILAPPARQAYFQSNLDFTYQEGAYRASLPGLPDENLIFSFMSRRGILFGITQKGVYYWTAFALLLSAAVGVAMGLGRLAARARTAGWSVAAGLGLGAVLGLPANLLLLILLLGSVFPTGNVHGYDTLLIGALQFIVTVPVTLITAGVAARRYHRRRASHSG